MGLQKGKKEKKEKKEKKLKKEKKEKKKKKQKVDRDDEESIHDTTSNNDAIGGLPPAFYETKTEEKEVTKEAPASDKDDGDADATKEIPAAEGEGAAPTKKKRKRKRKRKTETNNDDDDEANDDENQSSFNASALTLDTIFVEGIPFDKNPDDVRAFFVDEHGIPDADVLELRLPTWQDTGRLRGFGHVRFASSESYQKALQLNRKYMGRRYLSIQPAKTTSGNRSGKSVEDPSVVFPEGCVTIYVNNLPYSATEEDIATAFSKHSPQSSISEDGVRIARNSVTRQSKGFCYIDYETSKDVKRLMKAAIKKNVIVEGRIVRLDYDTGRAKGSFRTESGRLLNKNHEDN